MKTDPSKGKFYLIPYHACEAKPKYGTRVCQFEKRRSEGCQLHGELVRYVFEFKINPKDDFATVIVSIPADDSKPYSEVMEELWSKIKPYGAAA